MKIIDYDKSSFGTIEMDIAKFYWRTLLLDEKTLYLFCNKLRKNTNIEVEFIYFYLFMHCIGALSFYDAQVPLISAKYFKYKEEAYKIINNLYYY